MSDKYVIRNCPAYQKELVTMDFKTGETKTTDKNYCINPFYPNTCQDCTDCVMKRIVERCRKEQEYHKEWQKETGFNYAATGFRLANDILQLFDIEECE
jgi:hypothetical protein